MDVGISAMTIDFEPQEIKETNMDEEIKSAITSRRYFYIGVAIENGTALESLYKCEGRTLNEYGNWSQSSCHHADLKAKNDYKLRLAKVFFTQLLVAKDVCALESQLIANYRRNRLCINVKMEEEECFRNKDTEQGIVYLRVYKR